MSYDMSLGEEEFNYTYNVAKMWYDCFPVYGIREIYGLSGEEAVAALRELREHMEDNRTRMIAMEPSNGWGSYSGALGFVNKLILASLEAPEEVWRGD